MTMTNILKLRIGNKDGYTRKVSGIITSHYLKANGKSCCMVDSGVLYTKYNDTDVIEATVSNINRKALDSIFYAVKAFDSIYNTYTELTLLNQYGEYVETLA